MLGGPRRFVLVRQRPDRQREIFAAVATEEEAAMMCPEYMQDMGYAMGASFRRVKVRNSIYAPAIITVLPF